MDDSQATSLTITRSQVYPLPARRGAAWYWLYEVTAPDGRKFDNRSLASTMRAPAPPLRINRPQSTVLWVTV